MLIYEYMRMMRKKIKQFLSSRHSHGYSPACAKALAGRHFSHQSSGFTPTPKLAIGCLRNIKFFFQRRRVLSHHLDKGALVWGFTLIELLVVIAIIGILSSIVLTNLNSSRQKARDVKRVSDIKQLQLALALYFDANNGRYPKTLSSGGVTELAPTYIPAIPTPPAGVSDVFNYFYIPIDVGGWFCNSYHLGAALEVAGNSVLSTDSDAAAVFGGVPAQTCVGGGTSASPDFQGISTSCGTTAGTDDQCYDVTP